ncbi:MAG TPA: DNA repair protein RecN, partial [Rhizobiales bacterium]|nr:DNA repair protein RecN [Hyphomicrobiales bacterium]
GMERQDVVILRRVQYADGRTRAFINDMPVNAGLLRRVGEELAEIHGQYDTHRLGDSGLHRELLDEFAGSDDLVQRTAAAFEVWSDTQDRLQGLREDMDKAARDADYLRHAHDELVQLAPEEGEEEALAEKRQLMMNAEKITAGLVEASTALDGDSGWERRITGAMRALERYPAADDLLAAPFAALERALNEAEEARSTLEEALRAAQFDPAELEHTEERLFALRAAARKHNIRVDALPELRARMAVQLEGLENSERQLAELQELCEQSEHAYRKFAEDLSARRHAAARRLDKRVEAELGPLKLGGALFYTALTRDESAAGRHGYDRVEFLVATNPGASPGPLSKIASGGELARFMLALKVVLAAGENAPVMIFDEIDAGVGGAVADAVGARLKQLAKGAQVMVVTHSPQVAARGDQHFLVSKAEQGDKLPQIRVSALKAAERQEEIARMLSGARITDEARAAAGRLLEAGS